MLLKNHHSRYTITVMSVQKIGLFSAHSFAKFGGVQNHVIALYKEFSKRGIAAKIIVPGNAHAMPRGIPEEDIITIGVSFYIPANQSRAEFSVSVRRRFRERIWRENFDVLHFHNLGMGPLSYQILRHANSLNILTVHFTSEGSKLSQIPIAKQLIKRFYEPKFYGVIAVSPAALEAIADFGGFKNGPVKIIPNGIDLSRFSYESATMTSPHPRQNLLFVGRFEKRKGLVHLLRAFSFLVEEGRKNLRLIIVGEGEQRQTAQDFILKYNLSSYINFSGKVNDSALPNFYKKADVFCASAVAGESFGMTLLEAMACGTPIAGFANSGYSYVMQGHEKAVGENLLAKPGDSNALAQKIALLIDNKDIYERARQWGLKRARKFAWPKIADQVLNFYEEAHVWKKKAIDTRRMSITRSLTN